jgi:transcriptional regulator of acetoin/glycerol metabolism
MSYRGTDWPYLIRNSPNEVRSALVKAFRVSECNIGVAAKLLDMSRSNFYLIMKQLHMSKGDLIIGSAKWAGRTVIPK